MPIPTKSRVYSDALDQKHVSIYDYHSLNIKLGDISNYKVTSHIGKGKYSNVFEGKYNNKENVIIKVLKPIKIETVKREIAVLTSLSHANIVKLLDVVMDDNKIYHSLVFEHIEHDDTRDFFDKMEMNDIKFYSKKILEALDYAHSNGIFHRDIKPSNMVVNKKNKSLKIIDWGLAEFYHPYNEYHTRVATRYYKSPEILLEYPYYDYSLDIWSFGCTLADMFFKKHPFFFGRDNPDQLEKIISILGTKDLIRFTKKYGINYKSKNKQKNRIKLDIFLKSSIKTDDELHCIDLLEKIFVYDHTERLSASECLNHPFYMDHE